MSKSKEEFDDISAIQLLALETQLHPTIDSYFRKIARWFSSNFHTPLPEVEKMDFHYLLRHRFEYILETMSAEDLMKYKKSLIFKEELVEIEEEDEEWAQAEMKKLQEEEDKLSASQNIELVESQQTDPLPDINLKFP